jgi:hypothetical protein
MDITSADIVPLSQARANISELADQAKAGERMHLILIDEASKGLDDINAGHTKDARGTIADLKKRRQL